MPLAEQLFPASFRGVPFEVTTSDLQIGRRTQAFEYPQRDKPFIEDLGRSARQIELEAVIVGADFIPRMNRLIAAMEAQGAGTLVHPFLGEMTVTPQATTRVSYDTHGLGVATATLSFIESGEYEFPGTATDAADAIQSAANSIQDAAGNAFTEAFDIDGMNDYGVSAIVKGGQDFLANASLQNFLQSTGLSDAAAELSADLGTLVYEKDKLVSRASSLFNLNGMLGSGLGWSGIANQLSRLVQLPFCHRTSFASPTLLSADDINGAAGAMQSLFRQSMVTGLVNAASMVGTDEDAEPGSAVKVAAYDELMQTLDGVLDAIDTEAEADAPDDVFLALEDARSAVWDGIKARAERRARLIDYRPPEVMPALVVAYDYYADATRDGEIAERNNIRHPGFVPSVNIKLLSE